MSNNKVRVLSVYKTDGKTCKKGRLNYKGLLVSKDDADKFKGSAVLINTANAVHMMMNGWDVRPTVKGNGFMVPILFSDLLDKKFYIFSNGLKFQHIDKGIDERA
jgi:hypothetical protein